MEYSQLRTCGHWATQGLPIGGAVNRRV